MTIRSFRRPPEEPVISLDQLPTDRPVAVYYRQSTERQVGNVAFLMQTLDMVEEMKRRGWRDEDIYLIDMDAGISGTKGIEERPGMRQLYQLIVDGKIGAVACQDEDRLFRDFTQIEVNKFIEACRQNRVHVLTPTTNYVFHHPQMSDFFIGNFRIQSQRAADYLRFLKVRLVGARHRIMREGKWASGHMPVGYMVDMRKDSPTYRRYVPFEPWAEIVRLVFQVFIETGGNQFRAHNLLKKRDIALPVAQPPDGFKLITNLNKKRHFLSSRAIVLMVTNPVYLGHWMYLGAVHIWNNHAPIVDEATFFQAFNLISPVGLDGEPNPNYRPVAKGTRIGRSPEAASYPDPLLRGILYVRIKQKLCRCSTAFTTREKKYLYFAKHDNVKFRRVAEHLDDAVAYEVRRRLVATVDDTTWQTWVQQQHDETEAEVRRLHAQADSLIAGMQDIEQTLLELSNKSLVKRFEERYEQHEAEYQKIMARISELKARPKLHLPKNLLNHFREVLRVWDRLHPEELRQIILQLVKRVEVVSWEPRYGMTLRLEWFYGEVFDIHLPRISSAKTGWSYSEMETLRALLHAGASREQVLAALPRRKWDNIRRMVHQLEPGMALPPVESEGINDTLSLKPVAYVRPLPLHLLPYAS